MMPLLIKSTVCLVVFYSFYHFFLRNHKILIFNRFYLNISLVLALLIPLIVIPVRSDFTLNNPIERLSSSIGQAASVESAIQISYPQSNLQNFIFIFFILISCILAVRFVLNISGILGKILQSRKVQFHKTTIVLIKERTLPYSFFKYIFVNREDFENGKIEQELLLHEEAHCEQYHSIDILLIELINIFLWFNPAIWLFRRELLLNHEYSADNKVLIFNDSIDYQRLILNVLLRNNSNYLVSNFKFSLIKNRIIMMTKEKPSDNAIFRKVTGIAVFLLLGITLTLSKENVRASNNSSPSNEGSLTITGDEKPELLPVKFEKGDYTKFTGTFGERKINPFTIDSVVHYGIDIEAKMGTDVIATAGGKVLKAGWEEKGLGNIIVIDHGHRYQSLYAHLKDINVKAGDSVIKGQIIGHVGLSGLSTKPHLHFVISSKGDRVNPLTYLK
jgi:murein DD-endopeptidase MepM/ murein hydrolase activator NlpD